MDELLLLGDEGDGVIAPEGVSFDGVNDYLSRSTDLVGNTDSKTFTFSCWVYIVDDSSNVFYSANTASTASSGIRISNNATIVGITAYNSSGSIIFSSSFTKPPVSAWNHIVISVDLTNSSNRSIYVNDRSQSVTWTTYTNDNIDFTVSNHYLGDWVSAGSVLKGRLAHVYLDHTYRDLSVEANRRLFITEDLKPAEGQAALNPILYLPMRDADTAHINEGTGGDFVPNGVLDTAQRGPNQWNCVASEFDGSNDYLFRSTIENLPLQSKQFTCSFVINSSGTPTELGKILAVSDAGDGEFVITGTAINNTYQISVFGRNVSNSIELNFNIRPFLTSNFNGKGSQRHITFSIDMGNVNNRCVVIDGEDVTNTIGYVGWVKYTNTNIHMNNANHKIGGDTNAFWKGSIGELYFDTSYTDLSTDNPFWDADNNRPKPVRQVLEETGNTPLIAMPISADNPTKNYGTGGDFTLNGGGLVGARGASEFWARSAKTPITNTGTLYTNYLLNTALGSLNAVERFSFCVAVQNYDVTMTGFPVIFAIGGDSPSSGLTISLTSNSSEHVVLNINGVVTSIATSTFNVSGEWIFIFGSYLLGDSYLYESKNENFSIKTGGTYPIDAAPNFRILSSDGYSDWAGGVGSLYFTTDYIDFSQEENRNLFVDQLGYPKDLSKQIEDGLIPEPLIYMPFDDPDYLGKNLGTGGDFTVNGNITQGADFSI